MPVFERKNRQISVFALVMINIIAVDSLRTLPFGAELGTSLVFYYVLAAVIFFIPVALVAAELATGWPKTGGIYVWVSAAFGTQVGFITIWLQWIYNVVWYPTILVFIVTTIASLYSPSLAQDHNQLWLAINVIFWFVTLINCLGMRVSSFISTIGAIFGTLIPMLFIIALAIVWLYTDAPSQIDFSFSSMLPDFSHLNSYLTFSVILFGLVGMEMSAVHAGDVANPQKAYPRALLFSMLLIFSTLMLGSLAIAIVVPNHSLSMASGLIDAFVRFLATYHLSWMTPIVCWLIVLGAASSVSAWVLGPSKGMMIAAKDGCLPRHLSQVNKHGAPVALLILQALIFSLLSLVFIFMDSIKASYWLLSALTAQLALLVYVFMFAAAIKLRYSQPEVVRAYRIPGGQRSFNLIAGLGLLTCLFAIGLGFIPPDEIVNSKQYGVAFYELFIIFGMFIFVILPSLYARSK